MSVSSSRDSNNIQIVAFDVVTPVGIPSPSNIHNVIGEIEFNGDVSALGGITVAIKDSVTLVEEDITASLTPVISYPTKLSFSFSYNASNPNIQILTPTLQHQIIVRYNGNPLPNGVFNIIIDSCLNYFQNILSPPAFSQQLYDFNSVMSFNLTGYETDVTDNVKMYCNGIANNIGITNTFSVLNSGQGGSTPDLDYSGLISIGGTAETYDLSGADDIKIEIEKVGFTQNNVHDIVNAEPATILNPQQVNVYMPQHFDGQAVTYSSAGETHINQYRIYNPLWENVTVGDAITPTITSEGDISGAIVSSNSSFISDPITGEIVVSIEYKIDNAYVNTISGTNTTPGTLNKFKGKIIVTLANFSMKSQELEWESTVTAP